jgi:hypothetical protein
MNFEGIGLEDVVRIHLKHVRIHWLDVMNAIINARVLLLRL